MSLLHEIALTFIPGVGSVTARALLDYFGDAEAIFKIRKADKLAAVAGVGPKTADSIIKQDVFKRAGKELEFCEKYKIKVLPFNSEQYPKKLKNCYDAPLLLYYKGNADLNKQRVISIVGTRNATDYGKVLTQTLVADLQQHDVLVVSGLAYGIDAIAHKECLKHEIPTVGVVGHGLDRIYPAQHRSLAEKMLSNGGLLTEFPSETTPDRENFPKRNRIVAGMADATIIVEASINGGALITAELANTYNKDVFAYPGDINHEFSAGCNHLIKTNRASLITGVKDLEYILGWTVNQVQEKPKQISLSLNLTDEERIVVGILSEKAGMDIDALIFHTRWPQSKVAVTLLSLEMQGLIISLPGKTYKLS